VHHADGATETVYQFLVPVPYSADDVLPAGGGNGRQDANAVARINVYTMNADGSMSFVRTLENFAGKIADDSWHAPVDIGHPNSADHVVGGPDHAARSTSLNNVASDLQYYYQVEILSRVETTYNGEGSSILKELAWSALFQGELLDAEGNYVLSDDPDAIAALTAWIPPDFYTYNPVPVYEYHPAPEPTTLVLMLLGLGVIGLRRKKC